MTSQPPQSPYALNRTRLLILVFVALALVMIVGGIMGGVGNYQALREATTSSQPSSSAP
jgi:hypothetical protein